EDGDELVGEFVLMDGGEGAQRNGDGPGEDERNDVEHESRAQAAADELRRGLLELDAHAQIAMNHSAQPGEILLPGGAVEAEDSLVFVEVLLAEARIELERARLARREAQDREGDDRGEKEQDDAEDQAADDVLGHCWAE